MSKRFSGVMALVGMIVLAAAPALGGLRLFDLTLNGASENPANASLGSGSGTVAYDDVAHTLKIDLSFSGLTGNVTQTHFHATTATSGWPDNNPPGETLSQAASAVSNVGIAIGNPSLPGFPLGATSGAYSQTLDLTQSSLYGTTFLNNNGGSAATAEATFVNALFSGRTYLNIHSSTSPGGEIRGFPIPEPGTAALAALVLGGLGMRRLRSADRSAH